VSAISLLSGSDTLKDRLAILQEQKLRMMMSSKNRKKLEDKMMGWL